MAQNENVDARLLTGDVLAGPAQERMAEKEMKRRSREEKQTQEAEVENQEQAGSGQGWRQKLAQAKKQKDIKQQAKEKTKQAAAQPVRKGTNWLLRWSWITLVITGGLSVIWAFFYINFHVFMRCLLPSMFCQLGQEWVPQLSEEGGHSPQAEMGKGAGLAEVMGLIIMDLLVLLIVGAAAAVVVIMVDLKTANPVEILFKIVGGVTELGWDGLKSLIELFM